MGLEVKNCTKVFGDNVVLNQVSLQLKEKEILCLMGSSGAGKTTLLRCICGLEQPQSGTIEIDGTCLIHDGKSQSKQEILAYRNKVGLVFQGCNLFPHWTILQNCMAAPLHLKLMTKSQANQKAMELLSKLGINEKALAYPNSLSGGQKQRVAIARACMLSPKILCFDEPTSALDEKNAQDVLAIIHSLAQEGMGILIVTHDENFAKQAATRIIRMDELD